MEDAEEAGEPSDETHGRQLQYSLNDFGEMEISLGGNRIVQDGPKGQAGSPREQGDTLRIGQ